MDKATQFFALVGAFSAFCSVVAKLLPPGKAQSVFAWFGAFAAPKQVEAPKDGGK